MISETLSYFLVQVIYVPSDIQILWFMIVTEWVLFLILIRKSQRGVQLSQYLCHLKTICICIWTKSKKLRGLKPDICQIA